MNKIKFGTDGWRAIIGYDYTVENVARVSTATAKWLKNNYKNPSVVIGYDCRFGGEMFSNVTAKVFVSFGIKVFLSDSFVSTPMVSLAVKKLSASLGVVITASHNPPNYNGYKLKGDFGGPLFPDQIEEVERLIPIKNDLDLSKINLDQIEYIDLETIYYDHVKINFDIELINSSSLSLAYDPMFGAGRSILPRILPKTLLINDSNNPGFNGISPEPIYKNLKKISSFIKKSGNIDCGLATDGDADRIGLINSKGQFIDSHHLILLLIHYLVKYKNMSGKVVTAFSCSVKVAKMCEHYNLVHQTVKIGFKHIAKIMVNEDVLLGGEESGGIAIKGHIPERDGIWMGLVIWEYMAKTGKSIDDLIDEVYNIVGTFAFERIDLKLSETKKNKIIEDCINDKYNLFDDLKVIKTEKIDGYKYFFDDHSWVMIRPSGTEPVLRTYAEASTQEKALLILEKVHKTLLE